MNGKVKGSKPVERSLCWYSRETEELIGELSITSLSLQQLRALFRVDASDPMMYRCYQVRPEHARTLEKAEGIALDLEKFYYFVECSDGG